MTRIETEAQYDAAVLRIDELLPFIDDDMDTNDVRYVEFDLLCGLVSDYDDIHYPIDIPSLGDIIKLRMYEMNLTQKRVAEILGISPSRLSDFINGKSEPSLKILRTMCRELNIDASVALGL